MKSEIDLTSLYNLDVTRLEELHKEAVDDEIKGYSTRYIHITLQSIMICVAF